MQADWSSQQFFKLDEQLRRLRTHMENMTWKLDTWERNIGHTNKIRLEVKQYLEIINAGERNFLSTVEMVVSETVIPQKDIKSITEPKEGDNSTTLFNDTRNQTQSQEGQPNKAGQILDQSNISSNLDLAAVVQQENIVNEASQTQKELQLIQSIQASIESFRFMQEQPFRTVTIDDKNYVQAESIFVAVCLVLVDWMYSQDREHLNQLKNEFINSDCSWVNGNKSLPQEQVNLTGDICKKVILQYIEKLQGQTTNEILEDFDIGYILETLLRQYLINHSEEIAQEDLKDFRSAIPQIQVLCELAGEGRLLAGLEITNLEQGHEVAIIIGDSQCRLLTDLGSNSCFIEI